MPRPCQAFVPVAATAGTGRGAQGWQSRKCAPRLGKPVLSTSWGALYYYDYVFIEDIRRRQGTSATRPGRPDAGLERAHGSTHQPGWAGRRQGGGKDGKGASSTAASAEPRYAGFSTGVEAGWRARRHVRSRERSAQRPGGAPFTRIRRSRFPRRCSCRGKAGSPGCARAQEGLQQVRRQRPAEKIALVVHAPRAGQQLALLGGFHPFGDDVQAQAA